MSWSSGCSRLIRPFKETASGAVVHQIIEHAQLCLTSARPASRVRRLWNGHTVWANPSALRGFRPATGKCPARTFFCGCSGWSCRPQELPTELIHTCDPPVREGLFRSPRQKCLRPATSAGSVAQFLSSALHCLPVRAIRCIRKVQRGEKVGDQKLLNVARIVRHYPSESEVRDHPRRKACFPDIVDHDFALAHTGGAG